MTRQLQPGPEAHGLHLRVLPGDIVLTRSRSWLGRAIRRLTRDRGEAATEVNHVGIVVKAGANLTAAVIVEALLEVRMHPVGVQYGTGHSAIAVFRPVTLKPAEITKVVEAAESFVGRRYGALKLVLHLLDWCLGGRFVFRRFGALDRFPICSYLVARSFSAAGLDFGVADRAASPDDIWDFCVASRHYLEVRPLSPYPGDAPK